MATFEHIHRFRDDRIKRYLEQPRRGYQTLDPEIREDMLISNKHGLFACNAEARIDFAHIASQALQDFGVSKLDPHHFVSFAPADCVLPIEEAGNFYVRRIQQTLRQAMPGISFIGMVEAALYKGWGPHGPSPGRDHVSWHVHVITWRVDREQLDRALAPLKHRSSNMYDRPAVFVVRLPVDQIERVLLYILKGQTKRYTVNQTPGETVDPESGEVWYHTRQQKSWMLPGDHIRMCQVLKGQKITDLSFGNADGTWVACAMRYNAMQSFCQWAILQTCCFGERSENLYPEIQLNRALRQKLARSADKILAVFPHADACAISSLT